MRQIMIARPSSWRPLCARARVGPLVPVCLCAFFLASPALAGVWRFAVIGDTRGDNLNTPANRWVNTPVLTAMAKAISNDHAELVLVAGDLIYGDPVSSSSTNMAVQYALWTNAMA